jgi:hypothetical protein
LALGLAGADDEEGFGTQAFEQEDTELTEGRETLISRIFTTRKGGLLTTEAQRRRAAEVKAESYRLSTEASQVWSPRVEVQTPKSFSKLLTGGNGESGDAKLTIHAHSRRRS